MLVEMIPQSGGFLKLHLTNGTNETLRRIVIVAGPFMSQQMSHHAVLHIALITRVDLRRIRFLPIPHHNRSAHLLVPPPVVRINKGLVATHLALVRFITGMPVQMILQRLNRLELLLAQVAALPREAIPLMPPEQPRRLAQLAAPAAHQLHHTVHNDLVLLDRFLVFRSAATAMLVHHPEPGMRERLLATRRLSADVRPLAAVFVQVIPKLLASGQHLLAQMARMVDWLVASCPVLAQISVGGIAPAAVFAGEFGTFIRQSTQFAILALVDVLRFIGT